MICSTGRVVDKSKKNFSLRKFFRECEGEDVGTVVDDKKRRHYRKVVRGWIYKELFDHVLIEMVDLGLVHETIGL